MKKTLKITIGILGLLFTITGWGISNANYVDFVQGFVIPRYKTAIDTYKKMTIKGFILKEGDNGFSEITDFLNFYRKKTTSGDDSTINDEWVQIMNLDNWEIIQFKTLESSFGSMPGILDINRRTVFEIKSKNFHDVTIPFINLEEGIKEYYYNKPIFKYGAYMFWFGILVSFISIFL